MVWFCWFAICVVFVYDYDCCLFCLPCVFWFDLGLLLFVIWVLIDSVGYDFLLLVGWDCDCYWMWLLFRCWFLFCFLLLTLVVGCYFNGLLLCVLTQLSCFCWLFVLVWIIRLVVFVLFDLVIGWLVMLVVWLVLLCLVWLFDIILVCLYWYFLVVKLFVVSVLLLWLWFWGC